MNDVFFNSKDLVDALMETVNPHAVLVPTIEEQLGALIAPGQTVEFRTESGSHYEMICSADMTCTLHKVDDETDGIRDVASGELLGIHDRKRGVCGIRIKESSGRTYTTSAIVKVWPQCTHEVLANPNREPLYTRCQVCNKAMPYEPPKNPEFEGQDIVIGEHGAYARPKKEEPTRVIGMCTACGAIETYLNRATGTRDFSNIGESSAYPTGYGCELCD